MMELLSILETSFRTVTHDLSKWFDKIPPGYPWRVISDYCIGDRYKENDVFAFSIVVNHDTQQNIEDYISAVAPKDIKKSRTPSDGLISYLTSPVVFNIVFTIPRNSELLKSYLSKDSILASIPELETALKLIEASNPWLATYFSEIKHRLTHLKRKLKAKSNEKVLRSLFLVSAFAALIFKHMAQELSPCHIRWISDRDAIFDVADGLAFDLSYLYLLFMRLSEQNNRALPEFSYALPNMDGTNDYDELIRLPDYIAGTIADYDRATDYFSHKKFRPVFWNVFVVSENSAVLEIVDEVEIIKTRRICALPKRFQSTS